MKKISLLGICLLTAAAASAQTNLVKDVERQMKSAPDKYYENIQILKPAFDNDETATSAYTFFVAGKGGMDFFDYQQSMKQIGKDVDDKAFSHGLLDGYGYLIKALPLDSVADAKGKIKTKYSKDIVKLINNHYQDFNAAGVYLWGVQDYQGAFDAWNLYTTIPGEPLLGANAPKAAPDSILADIHYNMALASWQANNLNEALNQFDKSMALGKSDKNAFDYAIGVAYQLHDNAKMAEYASIAYPLYGAEDTRYIGYIINDKIANKQFAEAEDLLKQYIDADPTNSQLYYVLGILNESREKSDEAMANYLKAIELNPNNAQALFQYGIQLSQKAYRLDDEAAMLPQAEYNEKRFNVINPLFKESAEYLEKAYAADPDNMNDALRQLRNCYYNLNDAENLQRIDDLLKY